MLLKVVEMLNAVFEREHPFFIQHWARYPFQVLALVPRAVGFPLLSGVGFHQ
jgi:hypothetical protein